MQLYTWRGEQMGAIRGFLSFNSIELGSLVAPPLKQLTREHHNLNCGCSATNSQPEIDIEILAFTSNQIPPTKIRKMVLRKINDSENIFSEAIVCIARDDQSIKNVFHYRQVLYVQIVMRTMKMFFRQFIFASGISDRFQENIFLNYLFFAKRRYPRLSTRTLTLG